MAAFERNRVISVDTLITAALVHKSAAESDRLCRLKFILLPENNPYK